MTFKGFEYSSVNNIFVFHFIDSILLKEILHLFWLNFWKVIVVIVSDSHMASVYHVHIVEFLNSDRNRIMVNVPDILRKSLGFVLESMILSLELFIRTAWRPDRDQLHPHRFILFIESVNLVAIWSLLALFWKLSLVSLKRHKWGKIVTFAKEHLVSSWNDWWNYLDTWLCISLCWQLSHRILVWICSLSFSIIFLKLTL